MLSKELLGFIRRQVGSQHGHVVGGKGYCVCACLSHISGVGDRSLVPLLWGGADCLTGHMLYANSVCGGGCKCCCSFSLVPC